MEAQQSQSARQYQLITIRILQALIGFYLLFLVPTFLLSSLNPATAPVSPLVLVMPIIVCLIALYLVRRRLYLGIIANLFVVVTVALAFIQPLVTSFVEIGLVALVANSLLGHRWVFRTGLLLIALRVVNFSTQDIAVVGADAAVAPLLGIVLGLTMVASAMTLRYYAYSVNVTLEQSQRNSALLQATAQIGQLTSRLTELSGLFQQSVELIRDQLGYYHVQVFLVDGSREYANLVASTGEVGQRLLERRHRLLVGSRSVIGRVTQVGEYVLAIAGDQTGVHARNELLPDTRAELALPILDGENIIGALDVQSVRPDAFSEDDIRVLQVLANQLGISIRNARLFEAQNASLQENKRLFFDSEANLREIQRLNRQLTRHAWEDYLKARSTLQGITLDASGLTERGDWSSSMQRAAQRRRAEVAELGEHLTVAVPIVLRGEVIGAIEIEADKDIRQDDTVEMVQAVAQRLAISLDNARLFEESQEATIQEQRINDIVGRYQSAATVDELLQITVQELGEMFGAQQASIRLSLADEQTGGSAARLNGGQG